MAEWRTEFLSPALQIAAKNCRRRKMDQIGVLEEEVAVVRRKRERLQEEREELEERRRRVTDRLEGLEQIIISSLGESNLGGSIIQVGKNQVVV